jgi:hypothetical protein
MSTRHKKMSQLMHPENQKRSFLDRQSLGGLKALALIKDSRMKSAGLEEVFPR